MNKIISISNRKVKILGRLENGVYRAPRGTVYVYGYKCAAPEEAYLLRNISQFTTCTSSGIILEGSVEVGDSVEPAGEACGSVGCAHVPVGPEVLLARRHVVILGGTGAGKTTLLLRALSEANDDADIIVIAYHPDMYELADGGFDVVAPRFNICDFEPHIDYMLLGFHRLPNEPLKQERYLQLLLPVACEASKKLQLKPHEALQLLVEIVGMLDFLEQRCRGGSLLDQGQQESIMCQLLSMLREELGGFKYNMIKDLARERDRQSVESLYFYMLRAFKDSDMYSDQTMPLEGRIVVDLTHTLSLITADIEAVLTAVLDRVFARSRSGNNGRPVYVVVDELAALANNQYVMTSVEQLLRQGRKFGVYLIAAAQPAPEITSLLANFPAAILGRTAGDEALRRISASLPNVPTAILASLPALQPLRMVLVEGDRILPFRVLQPRWRK
ncbi:MAG: ATP-binding protein [Thermoproteus sp.]